MLKVRLHLCNKYQNGILYPIIDNDDWKYYPYVYYKQSKEMHFVDIDTGDRKLIIQVRRYEKT